MEPTCKKNEVIDKDTGKCTLCKGRTKPKDKKTCGGCAEYKKQAPDGKSCVKPTCSPKQRITKIGTCANCPRF